MRTKEDILDQARQKIKDAPRPSRPGLYFNFLLIELLADIRDILNQLPKAPHS